MAGYDTMYQRNSELAEKINDETLQNPDSQYARKFIGIANGQLVAVGESPDEVIEQLERVEPDPRNCLCFEAGIDYKQVQEIWRSA